METERTYEGLPNECWTVLESTNELILIKRGVRGYFPQRSDVQAWGAENKDALNKRLGVTKGQEVAMVNGSMYGWGIPASNPANYDSEGNYIG